MHDNAVRRSLNQYLAHEFGLSDDEPPIEVSESSPFALRRVHEFVLDRRVLSIFAFEEDQLYYAVAGDVLQYLSAAGMSPEDLELQFRGAAWIAGQRPIDMNTSEIGDPEVPPALVRRRRLEEMADEDAGISDFRILEGLYLVNRGEYLMLVGGPGQQAVVLSDERGSVEAPFPEASPWRRLSYVVGRWLASVMPVSNREHR